ncbi:MAG: helix-turn-helix domain-containing protein [Ktedonobacteraceae bacterium]|nr:helix-turn-helix domain-containing protein [Ktedonobacteraceae bacterium]
MAGSRYRSFSEALRTCRAEVRLTIERLAQLANVSPDSIRAWEGDRRNPRLDNRIALADALELEGEKRQAFLTADGAEHFNAERMLLMSRQCLLRSRVCQRKAPISPRQPMMRS